MQSETIRVDSGERHEVTAPDTSTVTVKNLGPDTAYYDDASTVSAVSNDGSLASGASLSFTATKWWASAGRSRLFVQVPDRMDSVESNFTGGLVYLVAAPTGVAATDRANIQAAIDAVSAAGGGIVQLRVGTYFLDQALSIPNFVTVRGQGQPTILRCTGNHYAINFNPGNRSQVCGLGIEAASAQTSGGAFNFTNAQFDIRVDDIWLGNNLHTSFNIKPDETAGHYVISRIDWVGVIGCTNGFLVGDGTNLVSDVVIRDVIGTASTTAGMTNWLIAKNQTDTLHLSNVIFYRGGTGVVVGENATGTCSGFKFEQVVIDTCSGRGLYVEKCRDMRCTEVAVQTCGDASNEGVLIGANAVGFRANGGIIQNCGGYGCVIQNGSIYTTFDGTHIFDNNTSNTAFRDGLAVAAGTTKFFLRNLQSGNGIVGTGHQKYGISITTGASNNYEITGCYCFANETSNLISDEGTGTDKFVRDNLPATVATVASAATITIPTYSPDFVLVSGTTTITSVTASWPGRRVTLVFQGALTFTDGSNLRLNGNLVSTADDSITLVCDGTTWYEVARSVN